MCMEQVKGIVLAKVTKKWVGSDAIGRVDCTRLLITPSQEGKSEHASLGED